ncbi:MAG: hypothetical protein OHK0046_12410 [Anaerolineae bacterium]
MTSTLNNQPVVTNPGTQVNNEGDQIAGLTVTALDPDDNTLSFFAQNLPAGLTINAANGVITGGIAGDAAENSPYTVTVTVTDNGVPPQSATTSFTWVVNPVTSSYTPTDLTVTGLDRAPLLPEFSWQHRDSTDLKAWDVPGDWYGLKVSQILADGSEVPMFHDQPDQTLWMPAELICSGFNCHIAPERELFATGNYQWTVIAYRASGQEITESTSTFTINLGRPQVISDLTIDTSSGMAEMRWTEDPRAAWYYIYIGQQDDPTIAMYPPLAENGWLQKTDAMCQNGTCTFIPPLFVLPNGDYTLYVRTWGPAGYGTGSPFPVEGYSRGYNFSIQGFTPPEALTEVTITELNSGQPTFSWPQIDNATWFNVWVGNFDATTSQWVETYSGWFPINEVCDNGTCTTAPSDLFLGNGQYTVLFDAWGPGGSFASKQVVSDINVQARTPGTAKPVLPNNTSSGILQTFVWQAAPNAEWYHLWVGAGTLDSFTSFAETWISAKDAACTTVCQIELPNYFVAGNYMWAVSTYSPAGMGEWSAISKFTVN